MELASFRAIKAASGESPEMRSISAGALFLSVVRKFSTIRA